VQTHGSDGFVGQANVSRPCRGYPDVRAGEEGRRQSSDASVNAMRGASEGKEQVPQLRSEKVTPQLTVFTAKTSGKS